MPYLVEERPADSGQWWVFKQDASGNSTGSAKNKKPYPSKEKALPFLRALYAAMKQKDEAVKELDLTVLSPDGAGLDPVLSQEYVHYSDTSPSETERCATCVFFAGGNFCYLVSTYPLTIRAEGVCDQWTEIAILADPAGIAQMDTQTEAIIETSERAALEDFVISEYKGSVPEVPDAPGIDKKALTEGDPKPTFVIRPIAQVGRVSKNGILYDQALIDSIREQIVQNHPIGIFGHIKEEDRSTAHPTPQAYWIGAKQYGDKLYAKAYIADIERAADIRRKKALNSADGTSIYGKGVKSSRADGTIAMTDFVLESLDFAPVDRASLDMGKEMYIASEQTDSMMPMPPTPAIPDPDRDGDNDLLDPNEDNEMGEVTDPMVGLTANWKTMPPDAVCEQIAQMVGDDMMGKVAEAHLAKKKMKAVAMEMEVVDKTVISEMQQQTVTIAELKAFKVNAEKRDFNAALFAAITQATPNPSSDPKLVKATEETRTILEMKARIKLGESVDPSVISETIAAVVTDSPAMMEMWRDTLMGPSARIVGKNNSVPAAGVYYNGKDVNDPATQADARARVGI